MTYCALFCSLLRLMPTNNFTLSLFPSRESMDRHDYEMGILLFNSGNFKKSVFHLKKAMEIFWEEKDFFSGFNCYNLIIQAFNEIGETETIKKLNQEVKRLCEEHDIAEKPSILSSLGYYSIYIEKNFKKAGQQLNQALTTAFADYDKSKKEKNSFQQALTRLSILKCVYISCIYYFELERYDKCIHEIAHVKVLLEDYFRLKSDIELKCSKTDNVQELNSLHSVLHELKKHLQSIQKMRLCVKYLHVIIQIKYKKAYKLADKLLWEMYEEANRTNQNFFIPYILCSMTWNYINLKDKQNALIFFNLAEKHIQSDRKLLRAYMDGLKQQENLCLDEDENKNYDIIFDLKNHFVIEKEKGCVELKNQFVLMDLLELFLLSPGVSYSKEKITREIWKENYHPSIHDNKIYVTIKRLRSIIEANAGTPRYILRNHAGYYLSKQVRALVKR